MRIDKGIGVGVKRAFTYRPHYIKKVEIKINCINFEFGLKFYFRDENTCDKKQVKFVRSQCMSVFNI